MKYLILLIFLLIPIFSETVILRDGTVIKGKVKTQNIENLILVVKGKETIISKSKLRRVIYAITPEQEDKQTKEELAKLKLEKNSKVKKTKEEEQEELRIIDEEIAKAILEQEKQERLNLSFEEKIKKLENDVFELKSNSNLADSGERLKNLETDISDLKKRTRRIERYLSIDSDLEDYYNKPRSMWSVVWRSALIPGWGLNYARDSFGSVYTSLFFVGALGAGGFKSSVNTLEQKFNDKILNDFFIQPYLVRTFISSQTTTTTSNSSLEGLLNLNSSSKIYSIYKLQRDIQDQKDNAQSFQNGVIGLYALQLIHSIIAGYFWSKKSPGKFSDFEQPKTSYYFNINPNLRSQTNTNYDMQFGIINNF